MACEIRIIKEDALVFSTEYFNFSRIEEFRTLFLLLDKKFPEKEGFELTVARYPYYMPAIERYQFKAVCHTEDWRDPLRLFVLSLEFVAFRQSVRILNPEEACYFFDNFNGHPELSAVRIYNGGTTIFEISGEQPLFKIMGDAAFQHTLLQSVEYELYLSFLRYHDPFPKP